MAELLLGQPLFPGESGVDQLVEIIKVLGTPTKEEIQEMNHTYTEYKFPPVKGHPWQKVVQKKKKKQHSFFLMQSSLPLGFSLSYTSRSHRVGYETAKIQPNFTAKTF